MLRYVLLGLILLLAGCKSPEPPLTTVPSLDLVRCLPVDGPDNFQPSGLTIRDGALLTVSDRHDDAIYRIEWDETHAALSPYLEFPRPQSLPPRSRLDFEGITADDDGNFYLVSETYCRILRISADGRRAQWASPELWDVGRSAGLFQVKNAYLEGIALVEKGRFLLCAEREPRGILEADFNRTPPFFRAVNCDGSRFPFPAGTATDFADICFHDGTVYVLQRNAFMVTSLRLTMEGCEEVDGWSYGHVEKDPRWEYEDMRYGHGEGLTMDEDYIYIILDNNDNPRATDPEDSRPLLFIFENPLRK
jgi:hypothetical protein